MAWWTLKADREQVPLRRLLGQLGDGCVVDVGAGFGICDTYDQLIEKIGRAFDSGVKRVKLKAAHGWDVDMLAAVRSVFPNEGIHIDCNSSYTYEEAEVFKKIDRFHLAMIEQPFAPAAIYDHAKLQKQLDTPICLELATIPNMVYPHDITVETESYPEPICAPPSYILRPGN